MPKDLRSIVRKITELPTLPQVVTVILSLIDSPDSSAEDINKVMEKDPSLVGKILKLVNSAYYGLPNKVNSVRQAIVILGFTTVVAGLLHDVGKLVLDQYAPKEFDVIVNLAQERKGTFFDAETEVLEDTNHAEIGAWVAEQWNLSPELTEAIRNHHDVTAIEDHIPRTLAAICRFSNFICQKRGVGASGNFNPPTLDSEAWAVLSLKKDDLPKIIEAVKEELARSNAFLNMATSA